MPLTFTPQQDYGLNAAFTRQQQGTANAGDVQNLKYAQSNGWKPATAAPAPTAPATVPPPTVPAPNAAPNTNTSMESSPGVFKASSLADFYNNQLTKLQPQFQAAQQTLLDTTSNLNNLQAPDLNKNYNDLYSSSVSPLNSQITDKQSQLATIQNSIKSIETDLRQQMGGSAPESIIQAEVAARSKPLLLQQDALTNQLNVLLGQRTQATDNIQNSLGYQKDQFNTNLSLLQNRQSLAKNAIDSYNGLLEKGATATQSERDNFRQLFQQLLYQAPDTLKTLSPDEVSQLQQGNIPASVMGKISGTINQQRYTTLTPNDRAQFIAQIMNGNPLIDQNQASQILNSMFPNGQVPVGSGMNTGYGTGTSTGVSGSGVNPSKMINFGGKTYDFSNYATDPNWGNGVNSVLGNIGQFGSLQDVQNYINKVAPNSPITAKMISNASQQYGVPWEPLVAIMQQESQLGTAGTGAKTFNPGNVGNVDSGATKNMGSWQTGVNAVAQQMAQRQTGSQNQQTQTQTQLPAQYETIAQKLATGGYSPKQIDSMVGSNAGGTRLKTAILNRASEIAQANGRTFDPAQAQANYDYASSQDTKQKVQSINAVLPNLDTLTSLSDAFQRSDLPAVNSVLNKLGYLTGNKKVSSLDEAAKLVGDELGVALGGGTMSDMKLTLGLSATDPVLSASNYASNIGMIKTFLNNRLQSIGEQAGAYSDPVLGIKVKPKADSGSNNQGSGGSPVDLSKFNFKL